MKKLFYFLAAALILAACNTNEPTIDNGKGKLDPTAMIKIRGVEKTIQNSERQQVKIAGLTPLEVVQQGINIKFQSHWVSNQYYEDAKELVRTFSDQDRDYETPALLMWGTDIITQQGDFCKDFIYGFNVYITGNNNDTIACVPDSVINTARPLIEAAYNDSNFTEVYRLFDEAFTFLPL